MSVRSSYLFNCSLYFSIICLPVIYSPKKGVSLSLTVTMNFSTSSLRSINLLHVLLGSFIRYRYLGFPGGAVIKNICQCRYWQNACQCRSLRKCGFHLWAAESCWGRKWWPSPVFLPDNPMDRGAWQTVHEATKSWTWPSNWAHNTFRNTMSWWDGPFSIIKFLSLFLVILLSRSLFLCHINSHTNLQHSNV